MNFGIFKKFGRQTPKTRYYEKIFKIKTIVLDLLELSHKSLYYYDKSFFTMILTQTNLVYREVKFQNELVNYRVNSFKHSTKH